MNCKTARHNIALHAGNDLNALSVRELKQHLHRCPECKQHWKEMVQSLKVLHAPSSQAAPIQDSVWPRISSKLHRAARRSDRFNGWAPALAVAASCMLMLFVTQRGGNPVNEVETLPAGASSSHFRTIVGPPADGDWSVTPAFPGAGARELLENDLFKQSLDEINNGPQDRRSVPGRIRANRPGSLP
jgi:hypothetical protein